MLLEEEPEEVLNCAPPIPPKYDFDILSYIKHLEIETPKMNELFLEKRQILKSSLEDCEEGFLWSHGGIVRTTRNAIKRSRKERERQDWENERNYQKYRTDERDSRHGE